MATEYYIVKPKTKEMYCLGKRINYLTHVADASYSQPASYHEYEYFNDLVLDILENDSYFMESVYDETWGNIIGFFQEIWEFIEGSETLLISDVSDKFSDYNDYKDAGSIYDFFDRVHKEEQ